MTGIASARAFVGSPATRAVPWLPVTAFYLLACGLAWAVDLPLWLSGRGLDTPFATAIILASMYTPAVAALIVTAVFERTPRRQALRRLGWWPIRPIGRTVRLAAIGLAGGVLLPVMTVFLAAALGLIQLDLAHLSGFAHTVSAELPAGTRLPLPIRLLAAIELASIPASALINSLAALGEETGWRGFLLPALRPLGTWPAVLITGGLWGLWHAPILLLGFDFDQPNLYGIALMTTGCAAYGIFLGWLRIRSGSIWPAVIAHGALNAAGSFGLLVIAADTSPELPAASPLGWVGWILMAAAAAALIATRQYPSKHAWATPGAPTGTTPGG